MNKQCGKPRGNGEFCTLNKGHNGFHRGTKTITPSNTTLAELRLKIIGTFAADEKQPKEGNICPDFDDACFESERAGCLDGISLPLLGVCPFLTEEE